MQKTAELHADSNSGADPDCLDDSNWPLTPAELA